jgi:hypothetical protein
MEGYRINYPEETVAWKILNFEYDELDNKHIKDDLSHFLKAFGSWKSLLAEFKKEYGDVKGIWLTHSLEDAMRYDGRFGGYYLVYSYDPKMMISDLGPDGFFVINVEFVEERKIPARHIKEMGG